MRNYLAPLALFVLLPLAPSTYASEPLATIPFVGCPADGQLGPLAPPKGPSKHLAIPAKVAAQLAYYKAEEGPGVLGPRGWSCFGAYGSSGSSLFIAPQPLNGKSFFSTHTPRLSGPAIQFNASVGDTSGRFEVAQVAARVFPHFRSLVDDVIAEGIEPASDFPSGPYPADKLTYKSDHLVEFITPANTTGLGTRNRLAKGPGDITGFAMITGEENSLLHLSLRLPTLLTALSPVIIAQAEHEAAQP